MFEIRTMAVWVLTAAIVASVGCQDDIVVKPDYDRPLPPGATALRRLISPSDWPDLRGPYEQRDGALTAALERSAGWFEAASSAGHFPVGDVTHLRAKVSVFAFATILAESPDAATFERRMIEEFDCYSTVGFDDRGTVLYTGYYSPIFKASKTRTGTFRFPLYKRPADLRSDALTGQVIGTYPTRRELEASGKLAGLELVYVASRFDQYIIQVNGSAKLELTDGGVMYVGYTGTNGREYTGLGATLKAEGKIEHASIPALEAYFESRPGELEQYILRNDRYVFFGEYAGDNWPAGSIGVKASPYRTIATDKSVFPRAGVVVADTVLADRFSGGGGAPRAFTQFMLDQDTGGAIRAAGRADLYLGIGDAAAQVAGRQYAEGRLYYFFVKNGKLLEWARRMRGAPTAVE